MRTDLSATPFLAAPDEYDGGELSDEDTYAAVQSPDPLTVAAAGD